MKQLEKTVLSYLQDRNWDQLRPSDISKSISIEAAELLELFQWSNDSLETIKNDEDKKEAIAKELADILLYALDLSVLLGFDTEKIILEKLDYVSKKYPAELMKKKTGKEPGTDDIYLAIKKKYRRKGL